MKKKKQRSEKELKRNKISRDRKKDVCEDAFPLETLILDRIDVKEMNGEAYL